MSMLKDIDDVTLGDINKYSCNISKTLIIELFQFFKDFCIDSFSETVENVVSVKWLSSRQQTSKHVISKLNYSMLGLSIASYTVCMGWIYMRYLKGKILEQGMHFYQDSNIAMLLVEKLKSNKEAVKRVNKFACDIIRIQRPNYEELSTENEVKKYYESLIESIQKENQMVFNLEKDEHRKIAYNEFLSSFDGVLIVDEIVSITTHCLLYGKSISDYILQHLNKQKAFQNNWLSMVNRGIERMSGCSFEGLDGIKSRYCNYMSGKLNRPIYLQSDWQYGTLLQYPNILGVDSLTQTLHTIYDINQRKPRFLEAGQMFLLWSFMLVEMHKGESCTISQAEPFWPYLTCALLRLYAPINLAASDCFYNTKNLPRIYFDCKNAMPRFDEVMDYLPPYFHALKATDGDEAQWVLSVNDMMLKYVGDRIYALLNGSMNINDAIKELDVINLSDIFIRNLKLLHNRIC